MEDIANVVQDIQYENALDRKPRPKQKMVLSKPESLSGQLSKLSEPSSFVSTSNNYLGYYHIKRYLKLINSPDFHALSCLEMIDNNFKILSDDGDSSKRVKEANEIINYCNTSLAIVLSEQKKIPSEEDFNPFVYRMKLNAKNFESVMPSPSDQIRCGVNEKIILELKNIVTKALETHQDIETVPPTFFDNLYNMIAKNVAITHYANFTSSPSAIAYLQYKEISNKKLQEDDFITHRILGRGGFGLVSGCANRLTGKVYALKQMNKKRVKSKKAEDLCLLERTVLEKIDSTNRFVLSLKYAFQSAEELFLVMDVCSGGDLSFHLSQEGKFDENRSRFYAAQVILGLEHLHSKNIVYRDLKPQNILLTADGNCAITDLGLACEVPKGGLNGVAGTRGYWAPEMLRSTRSKSINKSASERNVAVITSTVVAKTEDALTVEPIIEPVTPITVEDIEHVATASVNVTVATKNVIPKGKYGTAADWWSFGCLLYEFLRGECPFRTSEARHLIEDSKKSMDKATLEWDPPYDAKYFSPEATDLIKKLLIRDPNKRLGSNGAREIKDHPFFLSISWEKINSGSLPPPFKPSGVLNMDSQEEIGEFEVIKLTLDAEDNKRYNNWDYTSHDDAEREIVELLAWEDRPLANGEVKSAGGGGGGCCSIM